MSATKAGRAIGGGDLDRGDFVRLVYVDEAGVGDPRKEPYTVVAGVIVHADKDLGALEDELNSIVEKHIPANYREDFVLTAKHIFNGGGKVFDRGSGEWPLERRLKIAADLTSLIARSRIVVAIGDVKRAGMVAFTDDFLKNPTVAAHAMAYTLCAFNCEDWMRKHANDEICMLVVEDNESARTAVLNVHRAHQDPAMIERAFSAKEREELASPLPFRKIKNDPLFQPKSAGSVLQLADYCAYVYKRYRMGSPHYGQYLLPMVHRFFMGRH